MRSVWFLVFVACVPDGASKPDARHFDADQDAGAGAKSDTGPQPDFGASDAGASDVGTSDAGITDPVDAGAPDLYCDGAVMRNAEGLGIATYAQPTVCGEVLEARGEGVICAFFQPGDRIGPGAWEDTGWRAMNWRTGTGLGRLPHKSYEACLDATRNARGGVVCTNTGVGYKSAHIGTNHWCGSSSDFSFCLMASAAAQDFWVCSFPSDGDGSGPGWNLTHIDGASCDYTTGGLYLSDCNAMIR